jgi:hypothetical protein
MFSCPYFISGHKCRIKSIKKLSYFNGMPELLAGKKLE